MFSILENLIPHYGCLSEELPINCGIYQGCPLSPILFNLFINDILDNSSRYSVNIKRKKNVAEVSSSSKTSLTL